MLHQVSSLNYRHVSTEKVKGSEAVGFSLDQKTRYLKVQLTFGMFKRPSDTNNIPTKTLFCIPEFEGVLLDEHCPALEGFFSSAKPDSRVSLEGSLSYQSYDNNVIIDSSELPLTETAYKITTCVPHKPNLEGLR